MSFRNTHKLCTKFCVVCMLIGFFSDAYRNFETSKIWKKVKNHFSRFIRNFEKRISLMPINADFKDYRSLPRPPPPALVAVSSSIFLIFFCCYLGNCLSDLDQNQGWCTPGCILTTWLGSYFLTYYRDLSERCSVVFASYRILTWISIGIPCFFFILCPDPHRHLCSSKAGTVCMPLAWWLWFDIMGIFMERFWTIKWSPIFY